MNLIKNKNSKVNRGDLAKNCAGEDFSGAEITTRAVGPGGMVFLSGCFSKADFRNAEFYGAALSGDFSDAQFEGAKMNLCYLSGNFAGAQNLGPAMGMVTNQIFPSADFTGADLRGGRGFFPIANLENAQIGFWDQIAAITGTIIIAGIQYELCLPAQFAKGVRVCGEDAKQASDSRRLDISHIQGRLPADNPRTERLYDLAAITSEIDGDSRAPLDVQNRISLCDPRSALSLYLNAPHVVFKNFKKENGWLELHGNFDGAVLKDSEIFRIRLNCGSFKNLDLGGAVSGSLHIQMDKVQISNLTLPSGLKEVTFEWHAKKKHNSFDAPALYALPIIDAWNNKLFCEHLITKIAAGLPAGQQRDGAAMVNSRGKTVHGVRRKRFTFASIQDFMRPDLEILAGLVARRNQL